MNQKRPALGKGLSALFPASVTTASQPLFECPVDRIDAQDGQPRTRFDDEALRDLAESIKVSGIIQPLVVTDSGNGRYGLIAGERRLRAARMAGLAAVPVIVRQAAPGDVFLMALIENIQREDLNPVEQARAWQRLVREFGMTQEEAASRVGRQRSTVANSLRLLKLSPEVLEALEDGQIVEGSARALIGLDRERQLQLLQQIRDRGLSTREVEALASRQSAARPPRERRQPAMAAYFCGARQEIQEAIDLPVTISFRGNRGKISISFNNLAQFRALRDSLVDSSGKGEHDEPAEKKGR